MSRWVADWWEWIFDFVIEDRVEVYGACHDYRIHHPSEVKSVEWTLRRECWLQEYREWVGGEPVCAVCESAWMPTDDLHHRTYMHLGEELFADLVPLCRADHVKVHEFFERDGFLRPGRQHATDVTVARLRAEGMSTAALLHGEGEGR